MMTHQHTLPLLQPSNHLHAQSNTTRYIVVHRINDFRGISVTLLPIFLISSMHRQKNGAVGPLLFAGLRVIIFARKRWGWDSFLQEQIRSFLIS
jgi:hypothetical protein